MTSIRHKDTNLKTPLKVTIETRITEDLYQVFACVGFWNANGKSVYEANQKGIMGNEFTQKEANRLSLEEFIFNSLLSDFTTLAATRLKPYKFGKGANHIWLSRADNERVLLINF